MELNPGWTIRRGTATVAVALAALAVTPAFAAEPPDPAYGPAAVDVVDAAVAKLAAAPHRARVDLAMTVALKGTPFDATETTKSVVIQQVARPTRAKGRLWTKVPGNRNIVVFDGYVYATPLTGARVTTRYRGPAMEELWSITNPASPLVRLPRARHFDAVFGVSGEPGPYVRYRGPVTDGLARGLFRQMFAPEGAAAADVMTFDRRMVDVVVNPATGRVVRVESDLVARVAMSALRQALKDPEVPESGELTIAFKTTFVPTQVGTAVVVKRPTSFVDGAAEAQNAVAKSLLRNAAIAMESYFAEYGSFRGATPASLVKIEPNLTWLTSGTGRSAREEVRLELRATTGYRLSTRTPNGTTFAYSRGAVAKVTRTCTLASGRSCGSW